MSGFRLRTTVPIPASFQPIPPDVARLVRKTPKIVRMEGRNRLPGHRGIDQNKLEDRNFRARYRSAYTELCDDAAKLGLGGRLCECCDRSRSAARVFMAFGNTISDIPSERLG